MEEYLEPIETEIGELHGRDAVFMDSYHYSDFSLKICGRINDRNHPVSRMFELQYTNILYLEVLELDYFMGQSSYPISSLSFARYINSNLIKKMSKTEAGQKIKDKHGHFHFLTYDYVFELVGIPGGLSIFKPKKNES